MLRLIKNTLLLVLLTIFNQHLLSGQDLKGIKTTFPTSPQAEAFKRYGDFSVNYSIGMPDISIPLYEIDHRGYKIPLALKYFPQPLKPGYNYDVYGHGWGLSGHSSISRSIEFIPDEWRDFRLEEDVFNELYYVCPNCEAGYFEKTNPTYVNPLDYNLAHDKFDVVMPDGSSFNFVIDYGLNDQNYIEPVFTVSDGRQVKITCNYGPSNITSFTIVDESGVKYTFEGGDSQSTSRFTGSYVSWQLGRIDLPYSSEPIVFKYGRIIEDPYPSVCYEPGVYISSQFYPGGVEGTGAWGETGKTSNFNVPTSIYYKMKLLSSIEYGSTRVALTYNVADAISSHNYVEKLQVFEGSSLVRNIAFDMTIKGNGTVSTCTGVRKLAKLDSISTRGSDLSAPPQVYRFTYQPLPYSFSGTDHWGYFNTSGNQYDVANLNLFVGFMDGTPVTNSAAAIFIEKLPSDLPPYQKMKISRGGDPRKPSGPETHGVLSMLTYPSGGYTKFEFENHRFLTSTDINGNFIFNPDLRKVTQAAGFRIKRIINYESDDNVGKTTDYKYGRTYGDIYGDDRPSHLDPNQHTGIGEAVVDPNILTYMTYNSFADDNFYELKPPSFIRNMVLGLSPDGEKASFLSPFFLYFTRPGEISNWTWECAFSSANFRRILNGRPPVLYQEMTVYHGEIVNGGLLSPENTIGKTVHKYDITKEGFDLFYNLRPDLFIEYPQYIGRTLVYEPQGHKYNKPKELLDFKYDGHGYKLVRKEVNGWISPSVQSTDYLYANPYPDRVVGNHLKMVGEFVIGQWYNLGVSLLNYKSSTLYDPNGNGITSWESYGYNSRRQIISKTTGSSGVEEIKHTYHYPEVLSNGTTSAIIQQMVDKNIISPVIEVSTIVAETVHHSNPRLISGSKTEFKEFYAGSDTIIMPAESYQMEFWPTGNEYVLRGEALAYTDHGNPLETVGSDQVHTSYIWGYRDRYMIADVKNAHRDQVAYTSFEEDGQGNWSYSAAGNVTAEGKTGGRSYSGTVSKTGLPVGKYVVAMWAKGSGGISVNGISKTITDAWELYEWELDNISSVTVSTGSNKIDELRLHPSGAMMTSYTYKPLVGITSSTDPRGQVTLYEYDSHHRLQTIKDHEGNIVQHYDYKYAGQ